MKTRLFAFCLLFIASASAEEWRIGVALPLTGRDPAEANAALTGIRAAVANANRETAGPKLTLVEADTEGRTVTAALAADQFVTEHKVAAFVHADPNEARAIAAVAANTRTPLVGAGHLEELTRPASRVVFGTRAPLVDEVVTVLRAVADRKQAAVIFAPAAGDDAAEVARAFSIARRYGLSATSRLVALPADDVVALRRLVGVVPRSEVQIFVLGVGDCLVALQTAPKAPLRVVCSTSFPEPLMAHLGASADGLVFALPLPLYTNDRLPLARAYRAAMGSQPLSYASYTGYWSIRVLVEGIRRSGNRPDAIASALESVDGEIEGVAMRYGLGERQGIAQTWLAQVRSGQLVPLTALP